MNEGKSAKLYSVAELFCGCGGLAHGFLRSGKFNVVLGLDIKRPALRTFELNNAGSQTKPEILCGDIRTIPDETLLTALAKNGVVPGELDCLVGGPPCQGFSQMRRATERAGTRLKFKGYSKLDHDPRNDLVLRFLEIAEYLQPRFVIIENVPQMLRHSYRGARGGVAGAVMECLTEMQYRAVVQIVNMADYGVPQQRERLVIIASRDGQVFFPATTHSDIPTRGKRPWVTVADAISDLPVPPLNFDRFGGGPSSLYLTRESGALAQTLRSKTCFPFNHITRKYNPRILEIIRHMEPGETWNSASSRMQSIYAGKLKQSRKPEESYDQTFNRLAKEGLINNTFYRHYYWSAYTRLAWDRPALTITANANFLGSGRFTHPEESRGITMREAARLQTFEDDFAFITSPEGSKETANIGIGMDMIGEAVPPHFAWILAEHVSSLLSGQPVPNSEYQMALLEKHSAAQEDGRTIGHDRSRKAPSGKKAAYGHQ